MSDIADVVEHLELVIGLAEGQVPDTDLEAAALASRAVRDRVGHFGSTLVLALLGGTGAGKSSLLNAIAGERVASTSALRPHTSEPLAWIPSGAEPSLHTLLDELGVSRRVEQRSLPGIAILDMTDIDSVEEGHRQMVEALLPAIDVALWVLDPVKYGDAALHRGILAPSADASERLLFALNRIDTVSEEARVEIVRHLVGLLEADGLRSPIVFEVAADPPDAPQAGIGRLVDHLRGRLDEKRVHVARVVEEARSVGRRLASAAGVAAGGSTGFEASWDDLCHRARRAVAAGLSTADREDLLLRLERLIAEASVRAGASLGAELRRRFDFDVIEAGLEEAFVVAGRDPADRGESGDADAFVAVLEERFAAVLREALWGRATLGAAVAGLAVEAAAVDARLAG